MLIEWSAGPSLLAEDVSEVRAVVGDVGVALRVRRDRLSLLHLLHVCAELEHMLFTHVANTYRHRKPREVFPFSHTEARQRWAALRTELFPENT